MRSYVFGWLVGEVFSFGCIEGPVSLGWGLCVIKRTLSRLSIDMRAMKFGRIYRGSVWTTSFCDWNYWSKFEVLISVFRLSRLSVLLTVFCWFLWKNNAWISGKEEEITSKNVKNVLSHIFVVDLPTKIWLIHNTHNQQKNLKEFLNFGPHFKYHTYFWNINFLLIILTTKTKQLPAPLFRSSAQRVPGSLLKLIYVVHTYEKLPKN